MNTKFIIVILMLLVAGFSQMAVAGNPNPGVMPINSHPYGKSYGVWGQEFNTWLWQFTEEEFPMLQGDGPVDCTIGQRGKVWFLYGTFGGVVERSCTIPHGKALFIGLNGIISFVPEFGNNEEEIREDAKRDLDGTDTNVGVETLSVEIDGAELKKPFSYRADSPEGGFVLTVEEGTFISDFGVALGDHDPAIVDGYWLMLRPLSAGEHTIEWSSSGEYQCCPFDYSVTWHITVGK